MEELKKRYQQLLQAYSRLSYMSKKFVELSQQPNKTLQVDEENELIAHRDALIKRFELCYDLTWKFFKVILKEKYSIESKSPKKVFQDCYDQGLLTRDESAILLEMVDARNETSHVYDESNADRVSTRIIDYYKILDALAKKMGPVIQELERVR